MKADKRLKFEVLEELWAAGLTRGEIAAELVSTEGSIGALIAEGRRRGYDLPYRRQIDVEAQRRYGKEGGKLRSRAKSGRRSADLSLDR